jgi:MFS family permease
MQFPAGKLSDRIDRRYVLAALSALAAFAAVALVFVEPTSTLWIFILVGIYGAAANALYPIAVAHANDFAKPDEFVKVSGGLLLLFGIGTIIGPTIGGPVMTAAGPYSLFTVTAIAHLLCHLPQPSARRDPGRGPREHAEPADQRLAARHAGKPEPRPARGTPARA